MIIEYCAADEQDGQIEVLLKGYEILEWFNPEDEYYVLETLDARVLTILCLFDIEMYVVKQDPPDPLDSNSDNN